MLHHADPFRILTGVAALGVGLCPRQQWLAPLSAETAINAPVAARLRFLQLPSRRPPCLQAAASGACRVCSST